MTSRTNSYAHFTLHINQDGSTRLATYPDQTPILDIDTGTVTIMICTDGTEATPAAVEFGRQLASKAADYAAELARMHASQNPDTTTSGGNSTPDTGAAG